MPLFRSREFALFYQQLGRLYKSGISPVEMLPAAAEQTNDAGLREAARKVHRLVSNGMTLGAAFSANADVFPEIHGALITVGEENGRLEHNFLALAEMCEKDYVARKKLLFSLLYPGFLFVAALVLPKISIWFTGTFTDYAKEVFMTALPFLVVFGAVGAAYYAGETVFLKFLDQVRVSLPILGPNLKKLALARFGRCFGMLYGAGIELRRSLRLSLKALGNRHLEDRCRIVETYLREGGTLTDGFRAAGVLPREFVQMIELGERTGELDKVLEQTARLYEEEAEKVVNTLLFFLPIAVYLLVALYIAMIVINTFSNYYGNLGLPK